ncbi:acyl-CoA dehydratase activase [Desulforhopalus singaporensis]|uniref:CoA-substrate-specific enzyme activase, putative n=1 Tax=Desulforhopalus singaporensis TaxID=91360 RepID=A0A1H0R2G9_9BACT|nr:acyl-CoA dehydratase activase [Desulforhopalus singaporensis]SDP23585.1 CoA-substrate-specific enzyme activase, putative [Desulforhopalus singaporensis]
MRYAGIDIGSRTIELVVIDEAGQIVGSRQADSGFNPMVRAKEMTRELTYDSIMATGYGRNLFEISFDAPTVTEIKAHAVGARVLFPGGTTVLDIGGQDSKAISVLGNGRVKKFEMNDRCAAGTGKFMEIMARSLGFEIDTFGDEALQFKNELTISSMCTVFAESEVTSLIAQGCSPQDIAMALHKSVIGRVVQMLKRVLGDGDIVFTGGVALNRCMQQLLADKLDRKVLVPDDPQLVGALGAAFLARDAG